MKTHELIIKLQESLIKNGDLEVTVDIYPNDTSRKPVGDVYLHKDGRLQISE